MSLEDILYNALLDEGHDSQTARDAANACATTISKYELIGFLPGGGAGAALGYKAFGVGGAAVGTMAGLVAPGSYAFFKSPSCADASEAVKRMVNPLWQLEKALGR